MTDGQASKEPAIFETFDLFSMDLETDALLNKITSRVQSNETPPLFEYSYEADEEQGRFIDGDESVIRLLAPAGSGKTQSIANRVIKRASQGKPIASYLILTFDNAAAESLRNKFAEFIEKAQRGQKATFKDSPMISTLNSFGYSLLREELSDDSGKYSLGESPSKDQREAIKRVLNMLRDKNPRASANLPRDFGYKVYLDLISALKNQIIEPQPLLKSEPARREFLEVAARHDLLLPWLEPVAHQANYEQLQREIISSLIYVYCTYCETLWNHRRIDFDDQKLLAYLALRGNETLLKRIMARYREVIVDEFQDINKLDFELIKLLATGKRLVVVGDDDQAIYAFRGCSHEYILNLDRHLKLPVAKYIINTNYRCPNNIVVMADRLIRHNKNRAAKSPKAHRSDDADIHVWHCVNAGSEAQVIARFLKRLHRGEGGPKVDYSDMAVLLRMNSQSLPLQLACLLEEIPYHCRKEQNIILSRSMKNFLNLIGIHLDLQKNPGYSSLNDTFCIINCFFRWQHPNSTKRFHRHVVETGSYREAVKNAGAFLKFFPPQEPSELVKAVEALYKYKSPEALSQNIGRCFQYTGGLVATLEEALEHDAPLGELGELAARFRGDTEAFHAMLSDLLEKVQGGLWHEEEGDAVNIMTYFRAKGRQWHTVMLPGVNQKVIPHARAEVEDERRLFYVATTRATSNLIISYVRNAVRSRVEPSQFIRELGPATTSEKRAKFIK